MNNCQICECPIPDGEVDLCGGCVGLYMDCCKLSAMDVTHIVYRARRLLAKLEGTRAAMELLPRVKWTIGLEESMRLEALVSKEGSVIK